MIWMQVFLSWETNTQFATWVSSLCDYDENTNSSIKSPPFWQQLLLSAKLLVFNVTWLTIYVVHQCLCEAFQLVPKWRGNLKVCQLVNNAVFFCTWKNIKRKKRWHEHTPQVTTPLCVKSPDTLDRPERTSTDSRREKLSSVGFELK